MQDRVPVNPGRVLITPENGGAAYYATMTRADNPTQEGTPLNKSSLLKDATAALFGLDASAVPDDALLLLSRFQNGMGNEYIWAKTSVEYSIKTNGTGEIQSNGVDYPGGTVSITLYPDYEIRDDSIVLSGDPAVISGPTTSRPDLTPYIGYYAYYNGAILRIETSSHLNGASSGGKYIWIITSCSKIGIEKQSNILGYVNSPDPNAYPPSVDDGYTYEYRGRLGNAAQFATGSYVGTGTYGASNPCSLTFDFVPKFVFVSEEQTTSSIWDEATSSYLTIKHIGSRFFTWIDGATGCCPCPVGGSWNPSDLIQITHSANTLTWYNHSGAIQQFNQGVYRWIAIG